jgi:SNF2 family DNA or RNA helicase
MNYSLKKYFEEACVVPIPEWFEHIQVVLINPATGERNKPRRHQVTGLNHVFKSERTGLYDEQGTGKTLISQAMLLWHVANNNRVICLMPPVLIGQYRDSLFATFPGVEKWVNLHAYQHDKAKRAKVQYEWNTSSLPSVIMMTYQMFLKEWELFAKDFDVIIMDEAKLLSSGENKFCKALDGFMNTSEKASLHMTGTPGNTDLRGLYGFIKFTSPHLYKSKADFDNQHVVFKSYKVDVKMRTGAIRKINVSAVERFRNTEALYYNFYRNCRRIEKQEVLELPEKNLIEFPFSLDFEHYSAYKKFVTEKLMLFEDGSMIDGTNASSLRNTALRAIFDPSILGITSVSSIFEAMDQVIESTDLEKTKIFIMAHHQNTVETIAEYYKKYNPAVIYGKTNNKEAQKNKFLNDSTCRLAVVNYLSGGVGLNFQSVSYTAIAAEPTTSPGDFDQGTDRIHRSGQVNSVNIYIMLPKGTLFVKLVQTMIRRKAETSGVVSKLQLERELLGEG